MRPLNLRHGLGAFILALALAGCGGSGPEPAETAPPEQAAPNFVHLQSDPGDEVGQGRSYTYTSGTADIAVRVEDGRLAVRVGGSEAWSGEFPLHDVQQGKLRPGLMAKTRRLAGNAGGGGKAGLSWTGAGRKCSDAQGWFIIDQATYRGSELAAVDLRFEQRCDGRKAALRGQLHWSADAAKAGAATAGPLYPPPADLWQPAPGSLPASGNYVYLQSDPGDYIGAGQSATYTQATAVLGLSASAGRLNVRVTGDQTWTGDFQAMNTLTQLQPGYYSGLQRYPFHNPAVGGLNWSGQGRGCNTLQGWFVVDAVTYVGSQLASIDLRFEQHCEGRTPALRGRIHWAADDATAAPGPVTPAPVDLWKPSADATPDTGNYVYLQSDLGDYIGAAQALLYTPATANLVVTTNGGYLSVRVDGDENWQGDFQAMNSLTQLQPGYYGDLRRYPFHNPVKGGLSWAGEGRGCNTLQGWFVVDDIRYQNGKLQEIDLRFEQHCEGGAPALRGRVRWSVDDDTAPPGPVNPPPADLWQPAPDALPASGNYVYLQSDAGDYIGQGLTRIYTPATATFSVTGIAGRLHVYLSGAQYWIGDFQAMSPLPQLQPGYYGDLQRYPFHNPVKGGLDWWGDGRGCNTLRGWFVVDHVAYTAGALSAIDLRFEQHCEGGTPALRGQIHWAAGA